MADTTHGEFPKYDTGGAYHWGKLEGRGRGYHARLWARYSWFVEQAKRRRPEAIADVGCGDAALTYLLAKACPRARVTGVERDNTGVDYARTLLADRGCVATICRGEAESLPFQTSSLTLVTSCEVIEHVPEARALVSEAARVLMPDATLLVSTPQAGGRLPDPLHVHEFDPRELEELLGEYFRSVRVLVAEPRSLLALYGYKYGRAVVNSLGGYGLNPFAFHRAPSPANGRWHQLYAVAMNPR